MLRCLSVGALLGLLVIGCSDSSPVQPTLSPGPGAGGSLAASLTVQVDSLGSDEAIAALSDVAFDATASSGPGTLTYRLDFGDGPPAATPTARHVYAAPGNYTVTLIVTDGAGRTASVSRTVVVQTLIGDWVYAGYSMVLRAVEVRRLSVRSQSGRTVHGSLGMPGRADRPVTGELIGPRSVRLAVGDHAFGALEGVLPSRLDPSSALDLRATGGPAGDQRLVFHPAEGEATAPPPDAVLNHRYFSFSAPFAIRGYSPMRFDGSASRGDGLSYFIEFGDGEVSTEPIAVHPIEEAGEYTARLTVVDRFGRTDAEVLPIVVRTLQAIPLCCFWISFEGPTSNAVMGFSSQARSALSGGFTKPLDELNGQFSGVLSGEREIRLVLDASGIVLAGTLDLPGVTENEYGWLMRLKQVGGVNSGRELIFHLDSPG